MPPDPAPHCSLPLPYSLSICPLSFSSLQAGRVFSPWGRQDKGWQHKKLCSNFRTWFTAVTKEASTLAVGQRGEQHLQIPTPNIARKAENDSQGAAVGEVEGWKIGKRHPW